MKKGLMLCVALLMAGATAVVAQPTSSSDANKVRDVLMKDAAGFERGDLAAVESLWAHDEDVTVFENGHANYGWTDFREHHLKPELEHVKNLRYQLLDIKVHVAGTMAWATFKYSMKSEAEGGTRERSGVGTAALEKSGDDWKIVHWHSSAPRTNAPPPAAPKPQ